MTTPISESQRKAAIAAGISYLATFVIVVYVNFAIHGRLITDNPAETEEYSETRTTLSDRHGG